VCVCVCVCVGGNHLIDLDLHEKLDLHHFKLQKYNSVYNETHPKRGYTKMELQNLS